MIVDEKGECVQFKKYGNCRRLDRGRCTFTHNPASVQTQTQMPTANSNSTAVMTEEQLRQVAECSAATGRNPSNVTFEEVQSAARTPPAREMFTVLHQEKAEKGRKTRSLNAIKWKKWTTNGDPEEEDYCDQ